MNPAEYEITDGYIGLGITYETATEDSLRAAITAAAASSTRTEAEIVEALERGESVRWCKSPNYYFDHSYGVIRRKRAAKRAQEMVHCDCGHSVPRGLAMNASLGTACPNCYDKMSG